MPIWDWFRVCLTVIVFLFLQENKMVNPTLAKTFDSKKKRKREK
jgi:hypothetical protein